MGRRVAIALAVLTAATLAGCGHMPALDGVFDEPREFIERLGASDRPMPGDRLATVVEEEPEIVIARARPVATVVQEPPVHSGHIIEGRPPARAYLLDTGDRLRIFVYGQPNLSRLYTVDQSGVISIPLIGSVRARGLTTSQLEGSIRGRLGQTLVRDPQVTVDVQQNRPFFILGEVRTAGQYPYVSGMTVETAVAIAGGYGDRASERKARLSRRVGGVTEIMEVTPGTEIEPGDTIYVYERFF